VFARSERKKRKKEGPKTYTQKGGNYGRWEVGEKKIAPGRIGIENSRSDSIRNMTRCAGVCAQSHDDGGMAGLGAVKKIQLIRRMANNPSEKDELHTERRATLESAHEEHCP